MSTETKKILIPIGFSEQSLTALNQASMFAKPLNAEVVLLSVIEHNSMFQNIFSEDKKAEYKKNVHTELEKIAKNYESETGIKASVMVASGTVYQEVTRVAELLEVDLVIMGTNGKPSNLKQKFVGSNSYRVVSSVEPPVITVKGVELRNEINKIVFPLVPNKQSKEKVGQAIKFARIFGASIHVIAIAKNDEKAAKLKPSLNQVVKFFKEAGVSCDSELVISSKKVSNPVFDYRKKIDGDLIIITEDGEDTKLGIRDTDTEQIIYGANVPVMSITPKRSKYVNQFDSF